MCHLKEGLSRILGLNPVLNGDVKFGEDLVGSSNSDVALVFTEPVADDVHLLHNGDVEGKTGSSQPAELSKGGDHPRFHRGDKLKHL